MPPFRFHHPIEVRYGDLDPQWHVNNSRYLTFMEQTRVAYLKQLGLFDGVSFFDFGLIVADTHIAFLDAITLNQNIQIAQRVTHIGNKSMNFEYQIEDCDSGKVMARAETVMVCYDYHQQKSIAVPPRWRKKIAEFEGIPAGPSASASRKAHDPATA